MKWRKDITTSEEQAKFYNAKFTEMGGVWQTPEHELDAHLDRMGLTRRSHTSRRLLDLGCGDGSLCMRALKREQVWAWGIDLSAVAIEWAMEKRDALPPWAKSYYVLMQGEMSEWLMAMPDEVYDFVCSLGSMEHVLTLDRTLEQVARVLKPMGVLYLYVPNELWVHEDQPTELTATEAEWEEMLGEHGLVVGHTERMGDNSVIIGRKA